MSGAAGRPSRSRRLTGPGDSRATRRHHREHRRIQGSPPVFPQPARGRISRGPSVGMRGARVVRWLAFKPNGRIRSANDSSGAIHMRLKPIQEQVVVVVGASSGIGRETALRFGARGAKVVVAARGEPGLISLVETINSTG